VTAGITRRRFLAAMGGAAAMPRSFAQAARRPKLVGLLIPGRGAFLAPALAKLGWVEGRDVRYEIRRVAAETSAGDLDAAAHELLQARPDVLVAAGAPSVLALHRATRSIPIVCGGIHDPVDEGLARTIQQPGMNVTGLSYGLRESAVLQLGTLRALVPGLRRLVFVSAESDSSTVAPAHAAAAEQFALQAQMRRASEPDSVEKILATLQATDAAWLAQPPAGASIERIAGEAMRRRIAVHARNDEQVRAGLLLSYWIVHSDPVARIAALVDKVLRGADPGTIPFELPDKTQFAFNRATARAIGVRVPEDVLMRATEVFG